MFSDAELETLRRVAGLIIPASEAHGVPGADDPAILAEITISAERDEAAVREALSAFDAVGDASFQQSHPDEAAVLQTIMASCYYRDDRVLRSLGREARAPMPKGFEVEEGDFSCSTPSVRGVRSGGGFSEGVFVAGSRMGWIASAPNGVEMRHDADVMYCLERSHPMQVRTIGMDLAKDVSQVHGITADGTVLFNKPIR